MDWQTQLVSIYLIVSEILDEGLSLHIERCSNFSSRLTDAEILTIFLFGCPRGHRNIKSIHQFANDHLSDWFPHLRGYEAFNYRLGLLAEILPLLLESLIKKCSNSNKGRGAILKMIDSFPIIMAKAKRSQNAKVAPNLACKGYCASRGEYYYGVKAHVIGQNEEGRIPMPEVVQVTPANTHDLVLLKGIQEICMGFDLYADKAYIDETFSISMEEKNGVRIITPIKKVKGGRDLDMFEKMDSAFVSKLRQPIESRFNWLNEKVGIQMASKVRSAKGLMVHIFGKFSAAMLAMAFERGFNF